MKLSINAIRPHKPVFKSYNKINSENGLSASTSFYLDIPVLKKSVEIIEKEFPKGSDILIYAGSNGEEALSIKTLMKNPEKYNIFSMDIFKEAIDFAKRGIYGIHPLAEDGFLISEKQNAEEQKLSNIFHKNFTEIRKPKQNINNLSDFIYDIKFDDKELFSQKFFKPNDSLKRNIEFLEGDILDVSKLHLNSADNKAGAIFFRNALYHITQNDLTGVLQYGLTPNLELNKQQVLDNLIEKVHRKLKIGGIFVLGRHLQEHLYIADKSVPLKDTVPVDNIRGIRYMAYPPHIKALSKNGCFKPLYEDIIHGFGNNIKLPLIWQNHYCN